MKVAFFGISLAVLGLTPSFVHAQEARRHGPPAPPPGTDIVRGTVFLDRNRNGQLDRGEPGISDVSVTNGLDVVQTDHRGEYRISLPPESFLAISKPADYEVPVDRNNLPQFYYTHFPNGTPAIANWTAPVIEPTGPLPPSSIFRSCGATRTRRSSG